MFDSTTGSAPFFRGGMIAQSVEQSSSNPRVSNLIPSHSKLHVEDKTPIP